jgi:NAD(P)-dependent dehydrogenase (short-subunit alcohol dehydrogenase family)
MTVSVIITGASRGLGRATALILARMGASVTINARSEAALARVKAEIEEAGGRAEMLAGDVSSPDVAERLVAAAVLNFGGVDALINNAAVLEPLARIADSDHERWLRNFEINVMGPFLLVQAALPHLRRAPHGRVLNVSSGAAVRPTPGWSAYCVSKAAINMFTAVLAQEEPDITALAVRPGAVDTPMQNVLRERGREAMTPEQHQRFVEMHHRGELLPPELPGRALALMALRAPRAWSGQFVQWNAPEVQALADQAFDGED